MDPFWVWVFLISLALTTGWFFISQQWTRAQLIQIADGQVVALNRFAHSIPLETEPRFPLKPGESVVWELENARLAETRRGPRITNHSTNAFTFRFAPGFYYTAAGGKSVSAEPIEAMTEIDTGRATFTNKRVIFSGTTQTREWDFAKLLGWQEGQGGYVFMSVSNRQRVSGVRGARDEVMAPVLFQLSHIVANDGFEAARQAARMAVYKAKEQGRFMKENFLAGPEHLTKFVDEMEAKVDKHLKKMDELGLEVWVNPGDPMPDNPATIRDPKPKGRISGTVPQEIEIVGEFFYQNSFAELRTRFGTEGNTDHVVEVELRNDPDNPHSESGMAVAVYIDDRQVGHIPEALAPEIFELLEPKGGKVRLGGRLWLDHQDSKPGKSSVQVYVDSRLTGK